MLLVAIQHPTSGSSPELIPDAAPRTVFGPFASGYGMNTLGISRTQIFHCCWFFFVYFLVYWWHEGFRPPIDMSILIANTWHLRKPWCRKLFTARSVFFREQIRSKRPRRKVTWFTVLQVSGELYSGFLIFDVLLRKNRWKQRYQARNLPLNRVNCNIGYII